MYSEKRKNDRQGLLIGFATLNLTPISITAKKLNNCTDLNL